MNKVDAWLKEHKSVNLVLIFICTAISVISAGLMLGTTYADNNIMMDYEFYKFNDQIIQSYIAETPEQLLPSKIIFINKDVPIASNDSLVLLGQYRKYIAGFDIVRIYSDQDLFHTYWHELGHKVWYDMNSIKKQEYQKIYANNSKSDDLKEDFAEMFACYVSTIKPHLTRWNSQSLDFCDYYESKDKFEYFKNLGVI